MYCSPHPQKIHTPSSKFEIHFYPLVQIPIPVILHTIMLIYLGIIRSGVTWIHFILTAYVNLRFVVWIPCM